MRPEQRHSSRVGVAEVQLPRTTGQAERFNGDEGALAALRERVAFLRGFIAHPDQVGSVIPSSHVLEQRLVQSARLQRARCVVELGPGTGGTTRAFLKALPAGAHLLAIELSEEFAARLRASIHDQRLTVARGSAEFIDRFLSEHGLPAPDAVISGIPFSTMPHAVADRIAAEIARVLAPRGRFVAYQFRAHVAGFVTPYLGAPHRAWEMVNIPPVRVFTWERPG